MTSQKSYPLVIKLANMSRSELQKCPQTCAREKLITFAAGCGALLSYRVSKSWTVMAATKVFEQHWTNGSGPVRSLNESSCTQEGVMKKGLSEQLN